MDLSKHPLDKRPVVVADANVLFSNAQRNIFVTLHQEGVIALRGTAAIEAEWVRNVIEKYPETDPSRVRRPAGFIRKTVPDYEVALPRQLPIELGSTDAKDIHVAAAAIVCAPSFLATWNLKDFDKPALATKAVTVVSPDRLLADVFDAQPELTYAALEVAGTYVKNQSWDEFMSSVAKSLSGLAAAVRAHESAVSERQAGHETNEALGQRKSLPANKPKRPGS